MRLDPLQVQQQIANLKLICPEAFDEGDEQLLIDMLEAETDLKEFLTAVESRRQDAEHMGGGIATHIAELELRQRRYERREQAMRELEFKLLQLAAQRKVELAIATLSIRNSSPKVIITDDSLLPDILCKITRAPDKKRIGEMLKAGEVVRGCELSNCEPTISIRTK